MTRFVQSHPNTSDSDRALIGISVPRSTGVPAGVLRTRPLVSVDTSQRLAHSLRIVDEGSPTRSRRPRGDPRRVHGPVLHRVNQSAAVDELGLVAAKQFVKFRQLLGRHRQIGVEDHEDVPGGLREGFADGPAFAGGLLLEDFDAAMRILRCDALQFLPGVVRRVAFDEDQLGAGAQFGGAENGGFDVARFIARRNLSFS